MNVLSTLSVHNLHYEKHADGTVKCIEDEIPFELPEGWEWANLSMIGQTNIGLTYKPSDRSLTGTIVLRSSNIINGKIDLTDLVRVDCSIRDNQYVQENDILICARNGSKALVGKCAIISGINERASFGAFMAIYRTACYRYVYHFLNSDFFREVFDDGNSTAINQLTQDMIKKAWIPLPPIAEQVSIANVVDKYISLIDEISEQSLACSHLVQKTKSRILDLAIRGQLVPQNPDDEPAAILLERIRTEKESLIQQGKIKRDKRESTIFRSDDNSYYEKIGDEVSCIDDELPYDIPEGWAWCELQQCCVKEIKRGRSPKYAEKGQVLSFAQKCNQKNGGINIGLAIWIDDATIGRYSEDEYMRDGDIIINSTGTGTLGRVGVYHSSDNPSAIPIVPDSHVTVVRASGYVHPSYLYFCLKAMQSSIENMGEGSTNQKELKPLTIQQLRIPLPPYAEQIMICKHVHTMLTTVSMIEAEL